MLIQKSDIIIDDIDQRGDDELATTLTAALYRLPFILAQLHRK